MNERSIWWIILGGMLVTYGIRLSFIGLIPNRWMPGLLRRGLRYVPPAILAAIITPSVMSPAGSVDLSLANHRLIAGAVAALVAWRFRNTWLTIGAGMGTLWLMALLSG